MSSYKKQSLGTKGGFTLLELLIVVSIIAILSVALVLVLNPAETLKKSRDAQRISDLSTIKTALGLYMTSTSTPYLGSASANTACKATPTTAYGTTGATVKLFYSLPTSAGTISDTTLDGSNTNTPASQSGTPSLTDGTGWIPVNFDTLTGGSPISNLPLDPVNAFATGDSVSTVSSASLIYRYACSQSPLAFEVDAQLESIAYTSSENKRTVDGGNNDNLYEVGTNLKILGTGTDF